MSDIHAHELHQMMRSWLLAEDPYGVNQRIEPTMGTQSPPGAPATGGAGSAPSAPATGSPDEIAGSDWSSDVCSSDLSSPHACPRVRSTSAVGDGALARSTAVSPQDRKSVV